MKKLLCGILLIWVVLSQMGCTSSTTPSWVVNNSIEFCEDKGGVSYIQNEGFYHSWRVICVNGETKYISQKHVTK